MMPPLVPEGIDDDDDGARAVREEGNAADDVVGIRGGGRANETNDDDDDDDGDPLLLLPRRRRRHRAPVNTRPAFLRSTKAPRERATTSMAGMCRDGANDEYDRDIEVDGGIDASRCAIVRIDGSIASNHDDVNDDITDENRGGRRRRGDNTARKYDYAICSRRISSRPTAASSSNSSCRCYFDDDRQLISVSRLCASRLTGDGARWVKNTNDAIFDDVPSSGERTGDVVGGSIARGGNAWLGPSLGGLPTYIAGSLTRGIARLIDVALYAYDGDEYGDRHYPGGGNDATMTRGIISGDATAIDDCYIDDITENENDDVSSSVVRRMLAMDVACTPDIPLDDGGDRRDGHVVIGMDRYDDGGGDDAIDLMAVERACRDVLDYAIRLLGYDGIGGEGGGEGDRSRPPPPPPPSFLVRDDPGRVLSMLNNGTGRVDDDCSFVSLCRLAVGRGRILRAARAGNAITEDGDDGTRCHGGAVQYDLTEEDAYLVARTLVESGHACIRGDVIAIYPGGAPSAVENVDATASTSDEAALRIHVARIGMVDRLRRLERDADVAGRDAVAARRDGATKMALVSMRRRRLALEESERCASVLANLDASELALERAKTDVRIVHSLSSVRDALRAIRESSGIDDGDGVDRLVTDVRGEIDEMDVFAGREAILRPEDTYDEDELNDEFRRLELECDIERGRPKKTERDEEKEGGSQPPIEQEKVQYVENEEESPSTIELRGKSRALPA